LVITVSDEFAYPWILSRAFGTLSGFDHIAEHAQSLLLPHGNLFSRRSVKQRTEAFGNRWHPEIDINVI